MAARRAALRWNTRTVLLGDFVQTVALVKRLDLNGERHLPPERAALLTERLSTWQLHVTSLYSKPCIVSGLQHAFLEGRQITEVRFKEKFEDMDISAEE